jgi:hypothetical protein
MVEPILNENLDFSCGRLCRPQEKELPPPSSTPAGAGEKIKIFGILIFNH